MMLRARYLRAQITAAGANTVALRGWSPSSGDLIEHQFSMATEMIPGKPVDGAYRISEEAVADALGGIAEYEMLCSNLAPEGIGRARDEWRRRTREAGGSQNS